MHAPVTDTIVVMLCCFSVQQAPNVKQALKQGGKYLVRIFTGKSQSQQCQQSILEKQRRLIHLRGF